MERENNKWSKLELFWLDFAVALITIASIIVKSNQLSFFMAVTGVIYVILMAKQYKMAYYVGIVNSLIYVVILYQNKLFGTSIFNLLYVVPMLIIGVINYNKSIDKKVMINKMTRKQLVVIYVLQIALTVIYTYIGEKVFKNSVSIVDAINFVFNAFGTLMLSKQYIEQWSFYGIVNITNIIYYLILSFSDKNKIILLMMFVVYLINSIYGYIKWNNEIKEDKR